MPIGRGAALALCPTATTFQRDRRLGGPRCCWGKGKEHVKPHNGSSSSSQEPAHRQSVLLSFHWPKQVHPQHLLSKGTAATGQPHAGRGPQAGRTWRGWNQKPCVLSPPPTEHLLSTPYMASRPRDWRSDPGTVPHGPSRPLASVLFHVIWATRMTRLPTMALGLCL